MTKNQLWNICTTAMSMKACIVFIYEDGSNFSVFTRSYDTVRASKKGLVRFINEFDDEDYIEINHEKIYQINIINR